MNEQRRTDTVDTTPVNLAWTAGWDSSFRLLSLILIEKRVVQPHYLLRPEDSAGQEIDAMHRIQRQLFARYPESREFLLPKKIIDVRAVPIDVEMEADYELIKGCRKVPEQYLLLASYCRREKIYEMELGIHNDDSGIHLAEERLFDRFRLPLKGFNKLQMLEVSKSAGFEDLMNLTVFCRRPRNGKPCGFCGPCHDAVSNGLGYRLPFLRRVKATSLVPLRRYWRESYGTMSPGLRAWVSRVLRGRY
ncbi:MAG: hypothetical protein R6U98_00630 [Pirellulaceae bacterium]